VPPIPVALIASPTQSTARARVPLADPLDEPGPPARLKSLARSPPAGAVRRQGAMPAPLASMGGRANLARARGALEHVVERSLGQTEQSAPRVRDSRPLGLGAGCRSVAPLRAPAIGSGAQRRAVERRESGRGRRGDPPTGGGALFGCAGRPGSTAADGRPKGRCSEYSPHGGERFVRVRRETRLTSSCGWPDRGVSSWVRRKRPQSSVTHRLRQGPKKRSLERPSGARQHSRRRPNGRARRRRIRRGQGAPASGQRSPARDPRSAGAARRRVASAASARVPRPGPRGSPAPNPSGG